MATMKTKILLMLVRHILGGLACWGLYNFLGFEVTVLVYLLAIFMDNKD